MIDYRFFYWGFTGKKQGLIRTQPLLSITMITNRTIKKIRLSFGTEVPDDEAVLRIEFTGRTIAADVFL